jgi:sodium transport system permease protein
MKWSNVRLILGREIRDQLRDRRTLFMIGVLPLLLYPLLGMSFFQVTQFMREHPIRVLVVGAPSSPELPPLIEDGRFASELFANPKASSLLQLTLQDARAAEQDPLEQARREMHDGHFDMVVYFPPNFVERFARFHEALLRDRESEPPGAGEKPPAESKLPNVEIFPNLAKDASKAGHRRVFDVLDRWREQIGAQNLRDSRIASIAAKPFDIATHDVAEASQHKAAAWSKILPFVLLLCALTGAFYPAIDLCAGEKERGTLETLLSSPAERIEIVWGKLLTIMIFSMATATLNLASMAITGSFVLSQLPNLGPPPGMAILWLLIALVPVSALFSALCLALAAFARSTKEGQYYLMPLMLVTMPLSILPMAPGVELNLGNALIPITGVVLLLRAMLEGNYLLALPYIPIVGVVTLVCCGLAIRWATNQFNTESVLFREGERWDIGLWVKHLLRDRDATPSFSEAVSCGVLILLIRFFMNFALPIPESFRDFAVLTAVTQLAVIATPALLMAVMLTRSPAQTLLLRRPPVLALLAAGLLAFAVHPAVNLLQSIVVKVYPISEQMAELLQSIKLEDDNIWITLLVVAALPAICEELAFRGFILSGLRHMGRKWTAIVISSVFFGAAHAIFQQSLIACLMGMIIGFIAIQTGSLLPGVLFHVIHNSMALLVQQFAPALRTEHAWLSWLMHDASEQGQLYAWPVVAVSLTVSGALLYWFHKLPYAHTPEESLQEAIEHQSAHWLPG